VRGVWVKIYLPECVIRFFEGTLLLYRRFRYGFGFRRIALTKGQFAIVDAADYEELLKYKWHVAGNGKMLYAQRMARSKRLGQRQYKVKMHRQIMNVPGGLFVDHINHNGLDNRRSNLRIVTKMQNNWNKRKLKSGCSSKYKGVSFFKRSGKWQARIVHNGNNIFIGQYEDEESAARAYDEKAKALFEEYAALNFASR
jgi:hypothetical protein